ncbi:CHASE2 domain-containing protein [Blastomonas sp.]|uniref:CHASE2 domain-containing protein n=1 Tax=Blastomonas sp. TaxID=1909299 RepID=UPI003593D79C
MTSNSTSTQQPASDREEVGRSLGRLIRQLGLVRLLATCAFLVFAIAVARHSTSMPLLGDAENAMYDMRAANFAPRVDQDPRIVMVVYTDDTLIDTGQRSPVDRTILANALANLDGMGAKSIGIDILFDQPQDDDEALKSSLRAMTTPTHVAYASLDTNAEAIQFRQQEFLEGFLKEVTTDKTVPTSIRLITDADGVARRWPDQPANLPAIMVRAMTPPNAAFTDYRGAIRYRLPLSSERPVINKLPIDLFADPSSAEFLAGEIKGRHVLIGGDFVDFDKFDTPLTRIGDPVTGDSQMIGLEVHAHMMSQLLDNDQPFAFPSWALWGIALSVVLAGALTAISNARAWIMGLLLTMQIAFFIVVPFLMQRGGLDTLGVPSFGWATGWLLAYTSVGAAARVVGSKQRAFAQNALGKYLPRSVAAEILKDPDKLALHGEKREIFCVFTDLEGFTKLTHAIEPEMVAQLLNDYLDRLAEVVLEYGGTLDKFVGDAVVAFWGAPLSFPDDGERAARAAWAMYEAGEDFRLNAPEGVPPIGRTRVGLHFGEAIVGNFGGEGRIQYTAFGDSMNTAARLEAANKSLDTRVLVSREAAERSGLDWYRPMGRIVLRGRAKPVEIFEPAPDRPDSERDEISQLVAAHEAGDATTVVQLTTRLEELGQQLAIANLFKRLGQTQKGESYVLG